MTNRHFISLLCCLLGGQSLAAQERTAAEDTFARAFALEADPARLQAARDAYLEAAGRAGPAATKAQALLRAAALQRRLGDRQQARQTLERLVREHPGEAEQVGAAQSALKELEGIEARRRQSDWYRDIKLSAGEQASLRQAIRDYITLDIPQRTNRSKRDELNQQLARFERSVLLYGRSAVPQLMEAARSGAFAGDDLILDRATGLLLKLGVLPPVQALLAADAWLGDASAWYTLLSLDQGECQRLRAGLAGKDDPLARTLRELSEGAAALVEHLHHTDDGAVLERQHRSTLSAIFGALLRSRDKAALAGILGLADDEKAPNTVRTRSQSAVVRAGPGLHNAAGWLEWADRREPGDVRLRALQHAATRLRAEDGAVFDRLLDALDQTHPAARSEAQSAFMLGLERNVRLDRLPWNDTRLHRVMFPPCEADGAARDVVGPYWKTAAGAAQVAKVLLRDPCALLGRFPPEKTEDVAMLFHVDLDGAERAAAESRWGRVVLQTLRTSWMDWTMDQRQAALLFVGHEGLLDTSVPLPDGLRDFVQDAGKSGALREAAADCLAQFEERWKPQ